MNRRAQFAAVLAGYAVLALLAGLTLDGRIRIFLWILFGALALRTWIVFKTERGS